MLDELPDESLKVYAIWFNMFPGDSEARWPSGLLTDPRVEHYWDAEKVIGRWYGGAVTRKSPRHVEWDAYFLYDSVSEWGDSGPSGMISWGRTIVGSREKLRDDLQALLSSEKP